MSEANIISLSGRMTEHFSKCKIRCGVLGWMFLSLLLLCSFRGYSASPSHFERLTINDGLSNNSVRRILQDKKGFLWFGTLNGLNRFDGTNFKTFKSVPGNLSSLSNNRIQLLVEDSLEYLWVGTFDNQLHRFDPRTEIFLNIDRILQQEDPAYTVKPKSIVEGSPGVIWIISENGGLIRFMGSRDAKNYKIDRFEAPAFLPGNNVRFVHRDKYGTTWIGTDKGLLSLQDDRFTTKPAFRTYQTGEEGVNFGKVCETGRGIWFGTEKRGLFRYSFEDRSFKAWNEGINSTASIASIGLGKDNGILVTTDEAGVWYIRNGGALYRRYTMPGPKLPGEPEDLFNSIYADKNGYFWLVNPHRRGVTLFNPQTEKLVYYDLNAKYREPLGDSEKHIFFEDSNGYLWLGLYGGGLCRFDKERMEFDQYFYSQTNPGSLSSNLVLSILEDRSKNLWVGTFQGGLNKLSLYKSNFTHIEPNPNATFRLENEVRGVLEDKFGRLWVGTKAGKVKCYDQSNSCILTIPDDLPKSSQFYMHSVYSLLEDKAGSLWIGTKSDGLYRIEGILASLGFEDKSFRVRNFRRDSRDPNSLSVNTVYALQQDKHGQIWIGTYNGGLDLIKDPEAEPVVFEHFKKEAEGKGPISDNRVRNLLLDADNNLWIGTSNGLNLLKGEELRAKDKKFIQFMRDPSNNYSLSNNDVICLHQDRQKNIWAGTYGGGLNQLKLGNYTAEGARFTHFTQNEGLPSDVIYSILEDESGNLWIGSDNGLCKYSPESRQIESYLQEDGLGENSFSEAAGVRAANGELIFGHLNGFIRFSPENIMKNSQSYPIVFTDFTIFNERIRPGTENSPLNASIETTEEIVLQHNQNFIGIEFGVLDFKAPEKTQYSFILENFEDKWNYVVGQNQAVYRGLAPGEYTFKVKGTNSDGVWMEEAKTLKMVILPPFWKTGWAYFIYSILLIGGVGLVIYFVRHEIKLQNDVILERRLTENKLKFYTDISHEFKTPLTLISGPAEDLLKDSNLPLPLKGKVEVIKRNSTRLLNLIEQLLDFRRIQNDKMELKAQRVEIFNFLNDIYLSFLPLAEKKGIRFHFKPGFTELRGWVDPRHVEKIVLNLLSNAFKHAPAGKNVYFEAEVDDTGKTLKISIKDEGKGISKENLAKIFDRFNMVQGEQAETTDSSGIGLSLTRDLTHLHKGQIEVESQVGSGSVFTVSLPIDEASYAENEKIMSSLLEHIPPGQQLHIDIDSIISNAEPVEAHSGTSATKSSLLIIEDNEDLREYLCEKFRKYYVVSSAPDGVQGIEAAVKLMPDLIICDVMMPGISGLELTTQLKQNSHTSHIPIILLTGCSTDEQKVMGIGTGADDYITKPFNFDYLKVRSEKIIEQRKKLKEKFSNEPDLKVSELTEAPADQQFLNKVIALVEEKMSDPDFNVDSLIKELSCSRTFFYKKLKGISGYSPNEFVRTIRMKKAAQMLRSGDYTVAETSYEVGISDPNYFSKCFKTHFGETPSVYCKKHKLAS